MPDRLSHEAKELLRQFDEVSGNSLNAAKSSSGQESGEDGKDNGKGGKKKKFFNK